MEPGDLRPSPWFPSAPLIQKTAPISLKIASGLVSLVTLSSALPFSYPGSKFWKHPDKALKTESTHTHYQSTLLLPHLCVCLYALASMHTLPDTSLQTVVTFAAVETKRQTREDVRKVM